MVDSDNTKKAITLLFLVAAVGMFFFIIMMKLEVMEQQTEAKMQHLSADLRWENYLYHKAVLSVIEQRKLEAEIQDADADANDIILEGEDIIDKEEVRDFSL